MASVSIFEVLKRGPFKVTVLGCGNWGTAVARLIADKTATSYIFHDTVTLWVFDELVNGQLLSKIINETHENTKYLPGYAIPSNVVAEPDIDKAVADADLLIFVLPHQFATRVALGIKGKIKPTAKGITLIKGLHISNNKPIVFSEIFEDLLNIEFSSLCGANVAKDVADRQFCETTVGFKDREMAAVWQQLFETNYFRVRCVPDVKGVQACGAIKNVIALAAGFCDGMGLGTNTKAALIRIGVDEMRLFCGIFFQGVLEVGLIT